MIQTRFVLPDLISEFTEIDLDQTLTPEEKDKRKADRQQHCDAQAERIPQHLTATARLLLVREKMSSTLIEDNKVGHC